MTAAGAASGLRELADWLEANAEFIDDALEIHDGIPDLGTLRFYCIDEETLAETVRVLGRGEKSGDDSYFQVTRRFGPVDVMAYTNREKVCRKVTRTELREVEVTEWECNPIFAEAVE